MKNFYLFVIAVLFAVITKAQVIWPRTFSGAKDAIVSSYIDESTGDVYVIGSNGYDNNPVTSQEEFNLSSTFIGTTSGIGKFVAKFDKNGHTLWYNLIDTQIGIPGNGKVLMSSNGKIVALHDHSFYIINAMTGQVENTLSYPYGRFYDFELITKSGEDFIVLLWDIGFFNTMFSRTISVFRTSNVQEVSSILYDEGYSGGNIKQKNLHGMPSKLILTNNGNTLYWGIRVIKTGDPAEIYMSDPLNQIVTVEGEKYLIFQHSIDYAGTVPVINFNNVGIYNGGIYDYDLAGDFIYAPSAYAINKIKTTNLSIESFNISPYSVMKQLKTSVSGHYFFANGRIAKMEINSNNVEWEIDADTFEPWDINVSENYGVITSGWYLNECRLGNNNYLPRYDNSLYKSTVARIKEDGSHTVFLKESTPNINIKLSPNPAKDWVMFNTDRSLKARVLVLDNYGLIIYDSYTLVDLESHSFSVENWKEGLYYVNLIFEGKDKKVMNLMVK